MAENFKTAADRILHRVVTSNPAVPGVVASRCIVREVTEA
jgi:hypothetical protein